jgi:23S rRNA-/tRNA-specific pseudouridylate synthase
MSTLTLVHDASNCIQTERTCSGWLRKHRPEIEVLRFCHQIDYATSGILVFAKSAKAAGDCARLFRERTVSKEYTALVFGWPSWDTIDIDVAIDAHPDGGFRYVIK